ncbi:MAG: hypothetical protein LWY06_13245 [Firmicutes bacterium]|nr:hypothetical protein [Bacillota bacterium]
MTIVYVIIFLAALAVMGFFIYKNMFLEKNKVEKTFDAFIINAGFKWLNSADSNFLKVKHVLADATMDLSGYSIEILQMISRDFGKFRMYVCDITQGSAKGQARLSVNKTCLYVERKYESKDRLEIYRHLPNIDSGHQVLITGADTISAGIVPTFGGIFTVKGILVDKTNPMLPEAAQKAILSYQNKYPMNSAAGESRIYIDGNGIAIFGIRAWEEDNLKTLVNLAREIAEAK